MLTYSAKKRIGAAACWLAAVLLATNLIGEAVMAQAPAPQPENARLMIGWAQTDITPPRTAALAGMTAVRIASEAIDPLTATALALEAPYQGEGNTEPVVFVSCDLRSIRQEIVDGVRERLREALPELDPMRVILHATHTHNAPPLGRFGLPLDAMDEPEYQEFAIPIIAEVVERAWRNRQPGGVSFGLAHAVIGHNRIMAYHDGRSRMGGRTDTPDFSHVEGYEDPAVQLLYTWDAQGELTGVVVNVAVTSQVSQSRAVFSADYWHDARVELRRRLGGDLFVLPQCSAAGDQMSRAFVHRNAEARMERLAGRNRRQQIAVRLADAAESILDVMKENVEWNPRLAHRGEVVPLTRRMISEKDVREAQADAARHKEVYDRAMGELEENPALLNDADWQRTATRAFRMVRRGAAVEERFALQKTEPHFPAELHVVRLGDMAFATNPFELYLDFGIQIKTRSAAVQTFVVQLASGAGGYVPTARSVAGGAYGAVPASTRVGPEGGRDLVNWTVGAIAEMWD